MYDQSGAHLEVRIIGSLASWFDVSLQLVQHSDSLAKRTSEAGVRKTDRDFRLQRIQAYGFTSQTLCQRQEWYDPLLAGLMLDCSW